MPATTHARHSLAIAGGKPFHAALDYFYEFVNFLGILIVNVLVDGALVRFRIVELPGRTSIPFRSRWSTK
jgi:hypothetical protein